MNNNMEERLVNLTATLKPGETRQLTIDRTKLSSGGNEKIICKIHNDGINSSNNHGKVILLPFTATRENSTEVIISGKIDTENFKRAKNKGKAFKIFKDFIANKIREYDVREDEFNQAYVDDYGRVYEVIDGIKTYYDDRGIPYYLKYDMDGREYAWIKLSDGSEGVFLNPEKTIILVHDKAYRFDGDIHYDEEIDYIGPHR